MSTHKCFKIDDDDDWIDHLTSCNRCGRTRDKHDKTPEYSMGSFFKIIHGVDCSLTQDSFHGLTTDDSMCICGLPRFMHPETKLLEDRKKLYKEMKLVEYSNRKRSEKEIEKRNEGQIEGEKRKSFVATFSFRR